MGWPQTTRQQIAVFLEQNVPTKAEERSANESLFDFFFSFLFFFFFRLRGDGRAWRLDLLRTSSQVVFLSAGLEHVAGRLLLLFQIADATPTPHQEASGGLQLLHQPLLANGRLQQTLTGKV